MLPAADVRPAQPALLTRGLLLVTAAAVVIGTGLLARRLPGFAGDAAGGLLYAVLVYLLLALAALALSRRGGAVWLAGAAFTVCTLVELFQLTPWPARLGEAWAPLHLVFGSTFNAWDLAAYAAGATLAGAGDALLRRNPRSRLARS